MNNAILSMLDLLAQPVDQFVKYKYDSNTKTMYPKDIHNDMQRFYLVQSIKKMLLEEEAARAAASSPEINLTIKQEVK